MPMDQLPSKVPPTAASAEDVREALVPVQMRVRGNQIVGLVDHMGNELGMPLTAIKSDGGVKTPGSAVSGFSTDADIGGGILDVELDSNFDADINKTGVYRLRYKKQRLYANQGRHEHWLNRDRQSRGGEIGTGGKSTISFRFDHGTDQWMENFWPLHKDRDIPCALGVVSRTIGNPTDPYEQNSTTWPQLYAAHLDGFEVWAHTHTHLDPLVTGVSIDDEVMLPKRMIEAAGIRCMGWQQGGVPACGCPHFSNNFVSPNSWPSHYGNIVWETYGHIEMGGGPGAYRHLPTFGAKDLGHITLDKMTVAQAIFAIDFAITYGLSIQFMLHAKFSVLGTVSHTPAMYAQVLDYAMARRDEGKCVLLTPTAQHCANPSHSRWMNIIKDGDFAAAVVPASSSTQPWSRAGGGSGSMSIGTDGAPDGKPNYLILPAAVGYSYAYQAFSQVNNLCLEGTTMMLEADVRCTGSNTEARMAILDQDGVAGVSGAFVKEKYWALTAGAGWRHVRHMVSVPKSANLLQMRLSRRVGTGDIHFANVKMRPV